jgi:4-amino-4-deoxy-L-arabinose transferase-like glycosyltransferase
MPHTAPLLPSVPESPTKGDAAALPAHPEVRDDDWLPLPPARPAVRTYPAVAPAPVVQARPNLAARGGPLAPRATATRIDWGICAALMVVAAVFRAYLMNTVFAHVDSDQAVLGLMAYHIQAGERPIFYYGQSYMGSLEAYLAAPLFSLFGANDWTLRLPTLAFSVGFVGALYWLGLTLYSRWIAVLAGLFVALGPAILMNWSTVAGSGYIEVMVCGVLLFLLAVRYPDLRAMPVATALAIGFLAGLGVWMQPMIGEYLVPVAAAFVVRLLVIPNDAFPSALPRLGRALAAIALSSLAGGAPFLIYNLHTHWATITAIQTRLPGAGHLAVAEGLTTQALPILLGLVTPTTVPQVFTRLMTDHPFNYWIGVVVGTYVLARLILDPGVLLARIAALPRLPQLGLSVAQADASAPGGEGNAVRPSSAAMHRDSVLALFTATCLLFFLFSGFGAMSWAVSLPRYLIPMYTITPLVLDCFIPRHPKRLDRWLATLAVGVLIVAGVATTLTTQPRAGISGLTQLLEARHVRIAYTDYWLANRIAFETHERVLGVAVTDTLALGQERVPAYLPVAARTPAAKEAWIFVAGSAGEKRFRRLMQRRSIHATRLSWDGQAVYVQLSRPLRPVAG